MSRWRPASRRSSRRGRHRHRLAGLRAGASRSSPRPWTPSSTSAFAAELARLGGVAVLNLEGVQARYDDPAAVLERIAARPRRRGPRRPRRGVPGAHPGRADRPAHRGAAGRRLAGRACPPRRRRRAGSARLCAEHGADLFLVQSQVSSARHIATGYEALELSEFTRLMGIPVAVGNTTSYDAAYQLMGQGIAADLRGCRAGRRVHDPRRAGHRRAPDHGHRGRRRRARRVLRRHRPLRAGRRRRRHAPGWRAGQGHRRRAPTR